MMLVITSAPACADRQQEREPNLSFRSSANVPPAFAGYAFGQAKDGPKCCLAGGVGRYAGQSIVLGLWCQNTAQAEQGVFPAAGDAWNRFLSQIRSQGSK
jgi:hypothetical protein